MFVASLILSVVAGFYYYLQVKPEVYVFLSFALVVPLLLCLPRVIYRLGHVRAGWLRATDALGLGYVLLNVPGTMWFHSRFAEFQYDRLLHFGAALLTVMLVVYFWVGLGGRAGKWVVFTAAGIVFIGMFAWEFFQWSQDRLFGTHMFYDYAQGLGWDVSEDLFYGALGIIAAIPLGLSLVPSIRRQEINHVSHR